MKNFRANSVFQGKPSCSKNDVNGIKYIQYNEFRANSVFQGKRKVAQYYREC